MRSYYEAGVPSPETAYDASFAVLFQRVTKSARWEKTKEAIQAAIEEGSMKCEIAFSKKEYTLCDVEELKHILQHLGYHTYIDGENSNSAFSLHVSWWK